MIIFYLLLCIINNIVSLSHYELASMKHMEAEHIGYHPYSPRVSIVPWVIVQDTNLCINAYLICQPTTLSDCWACWAYTLHTHTIQRWLSRILHFKAGMVYSSFVDALAHHPLQCIFVWYPLSFPFNYNLIEVSMYNGGQIVEYFSITKLVGLYVLMANTSFLKPRRFKGTITVDMTVIWWIVI